MHRHCKRLRDRHIKIILSTAFLLGFGVLMLFPRQEKTTDLQFVRTDTTTSHGVAQDWNYLFSNDSWTQVYQWTSSGTLNTNPTMNTSSITTIFTGETVVNAPQTDLKNIFITTIPQLLPQNVSDLLLAALNAKLNTQTTAKDCTAPRGETVKNNDFVLAYGQRIDVNVICNVQKRLCNNGILWGTYTQRSCQDNIIYSYHKAEVISYNEKKLNEYIQPGPAINSGAEFNTEWKINQWTETPSTTRWDPANIASQSDAEVSQTEKYATSCFTPRGGVIKHGQFTKAYKSPIGLIDLPCEVELRACINGTLKWNYTYQKCTVKNMTYNDYLANNRDITQPTVKDIQESLNNN